MSTLTVAFSRAHSVTYVTDKLLLTLKEIIRESGLDPAKMSRVAPTLESGIKVWLESGHLETVHLEVVDPKKPELLGRWDIAVAYAQNSEDSLWVDTSLVRYSIAKAGLSGKDCDYTISVNLSSGAPSVAGWGSHTLLSTNGLREYSLGTTIGAPGMGARTSYWSRT